MNFMQACIASDTSMLSRSWHTLTGQMMTSDAQRGFRLQQRCLTLMSQVQAGNGTIFFFLRILKTLAKVILGFAGPVRNNAPSSRCSSTSRERMTGALHSSWGKRSSMLLKSLSASRANSGLPLRPVRLSTRACARLSMQGVMQLVSSTYSNHSGCDVSQELACHTSRL